MRKERNLHCDVHVTAENKHTLSPFGTRSGSCNRSDPDVAIKAYTPFFCFDNNTDESVMSPIETMTIMFFCHTREFKLKHSLTCRVFSVALWMSVMKQFTGLRLVYTGNFYVSIHFHLYVFYVVLLIAFYISVGISF